MAQTIVMPKLGLTMTEGTISRWLKKEGETVTKGEGLFEVETDKLTNTAEASKDGILGKILVCEGETVDCLVPVAVLLAPGEELGDIPAAETKGETAPGDEPKSAAKTADSGRERSKTVLASPAAKKLAKQHQIDLSQVTATGPGGRIVLEDVELYMKEGGNKPGTNAGPKASPLASKIASDHKVELYHIHGDKGRIMSADVLEYMNRAAKEAPQEIVPMSNMRKIIASRMSESQKISPFVNYDISIDMTALKRMKGELVTEEIKVSYTDLLVKFVAKALMEFPYMNCSIDQNNIILKRDINIGLAVAVKDGLLVPVIKNVQMMNLQEISAESKKLAGGARDGTLDPGALSGGTFTITNLGMFGIESFTPIINQPEVAILGVNAMLDTPVVINKEIVIRPLMKLSLTADHRVVDGALAAQFLARLKKLMEAPALMF